MKRFWYLVAALVMIYGALDGPRPNCPLPTSCPLSVR